jgi:hypothetical protein
VPRQRHPLRLLAQRPRLREVCGAVVLPDFTSDGHTRTRRFGDASHARTCGKCAEIISYLVTQSLGAQKLPDGRSRLEACMSMRGRTP